jgi:hypothetical protein
MEYNFKMEGLEEFTKALNEYDSRLQKDVMRTGFNEASKPLIEAAKDNAVGENLKKSVGVKVSKGAGIATVGARKFRPYKGYLGHIQEEGTQDRQYISKKGKVHPTGRVTGNKWFSRAVEATEDLIYNGIVKTMEDALNKVIDKYNKKY